jgi:CBS domain-containing protein
MEQKGTLVREYMTACPLTVSSRDSIAVASRVMRERRIRHIPVVDERRLAGMISDRDVSLVLSLEEVDPRCVTVGTVMTADPYVVEAETPLKTVVEKMAMDRLEAAVVISGQEIAGIFTTVDALMAFSKHL